MGARHSSGRDCQLAVIVGGYIEGVLADDLREEIGFVSAKYHMFISKVSRGRLVWGLISDAPICIDDHEGLKVDADLVPKIYEVAKELVDRMSSRFADACDASMLRMAILARRGDGCIFRMSIPSDVVGIAAPLRLSSFLVGESVPICDVYGLPDPFDVSAPVSPSQVAFRLTVVTSEYSLLDIDRALELPCSSPVCRDMDRDDSGQVVSPTQWRLRPTYSGERDLDEVICWTAEAIDAIDKIWSRLVANGMVLVRIKLDIWPSSRDGQKRCRVVISPKLLAIASAVPLDIYVVFTPHAP